MSEVTTITCDRCAEKTTKAHRSKIKWGRESGCRGSYDLCGECSEWIAAKLGMVPERLPGFDLGPRPGDPSPEEICARAAAIKGANLTLCATRDQR
jgi:hypothetical protein